MKIYVVDRDYYFLKEFEAAMKKVSPLSKVKCLTGTEMLQTAIAEEGCDVLFLEADAKGSLRAAETIIKANPALNLIAVSDSDKYVLDYAQLALSGYMVKPISPEQIRNQLFHVRHPLMSKLAGK